MRSTMTRREVMKTGIWAAAAAGAWRPGGVALAQGAETLSIAHTIEAPTLDPHQTSWREARITTHQVFDFLMTSTGEGVLPGLATKWESSADGRTWTLTLRTGAKFHDGTLVDAEAVRFNFERLVELGSKAGGLSALGSVIAKVEAPSATQVRIALKQPYGGFLNLVGGELFGIVSPAGVKKHGADFGRNPVGSGPYVFESWTANTQLIVRRNPDYAWAPGPFKGGPAQIEKLVYRVIPEAAAFTASLERGENQILDFVSPTDVLRLQRGAKFEVVVQTTPGVPASYYFNTEQGPTADRQVRQALALAIDRDELGRSMAMGQGLVPIAYSYLTKTNWAHDAQLEASKPFAYDAERAKRMLDEAGWRPGADGIRTKDGKPLRLALLALSALPIYTATALIVQGQLRKVGVDIEVRQLDQATLMGAMTRGEHHLVMFSAGGYDPDACMFRTFHSTGGANWARYKSRDVDQLLERGATEMDPARRRALYRQVQDALFKDLPVLPMFVYAGIVVRDSRVGGVWWDPRSGFRLHEARLAR